MSSHIESLRKGGSNHNSFSLTQISPRQPNPFSRTEPCKAAAQVFSIQGEVRTSSATSASRNAQSRHFCLGVQILLHLFYYYLKLFLSCRPVILYTGLVLAVYFCLSPIRKKLVSLLLTTLNKNQLSNSQC